MADIRQETDSQRKRQTGRQTERAKGTENDGDEKSDRNRRTRKVKDSIRTRRME